MTTATVFLLVFVKAANAGGLTAMPMPSMAACERERAKIEAGLASAWIASARMFCVDARQ